MHAFDGENEVSRRKAEAKRAGDAYMQLADFHRPRRRFFLGAMLAALGRRMKTTGDQLPANPFPTRNTTDQTI